MAAFGAARRRALHPGPYAASSSCSQGRLGAPAPRNTLCGRRGSSATPKPVDALCGACAGRRRRHTIGIIGLLSDVARRCGARRSPLAETSFDSMAGQAERRVRSWSTDSTRRRQSRSRHAHDRALRRRHLTTTLSTGPHGQMSTSASFLRGGDGRQNPDAAITLVTEALWNCFVAMARGRDPRGRGSSQRTRGYLRAIAGRFRTRTNADANDGGARRTRRKRRRRPAQCKPRAVVVGRCR